MPLCVIDESCILCCACIDECLLEAIREGDEVMVVDPEKCNGCGTCVEICPVCACKIVF